MTLAKPNQGDHMKRLVTLLLLSTVALTGCSSGPSEAELKAAIPAGFTDGGEGIAWKAGDTYTSTNQDPKACSYLGSGWQCLDISYYAYADCSSVMALGTENDLFTDEVINNELPNNTFDMPVVSAGDEGVYTISQDHSPNSEYNDGYWIVTGLSCN